MSEVMVEEMQETEEQGMNPFFAALAASQERGTVQTPIHSLHSRMGELEFSAQAGDIRDWQEKLQEVQETKEELGLEGLKELEIRVQIKKLEMTLLLNASQNALRDSKMAEQQAEFAAQNGDEAEAQTNRNKAQKLARLGKQLQDQLLLKTA